MSRKNTIKYTGALASEAGQSLFNWPDGQQTDQAGVSVAPVRRSRSLEKRNDARNAAAVLSRALDELATSYAASAAIRGLPTPGIYGRNSGGSSPSADLQSCLANKFRARMENYGSPEFEVRWKSSDMVLGPPIFRLAPRVRRTGGTGCFGWPTPRASPNENRNTRSAPSHGVTHGLTLAGVARDLAGWSTPRSSDGEKGGPNMAWSAGGTPLPAQAAQLAGWCTPTTPSGGQTNPEGTTITGRRPDGTKATVTLKDQVEQLAGWTTPQEQDAKQCGNRPHSKAEMLIQQALGTPTLSSDPIPKANTGALAPEFCAWLMGFPIQWLWAAPNRMPGIQKRKRRL